MKIGWASPINTRSAIGKFSAHVCNELHRRGHDVEIIRTETEAALLAEAIRGTFATVDTSACDVDRYDVLVVNFGNHTPYHGGMLPLLVERACLGIFHDIETRHFEWGVEQRHNVALPKLLGISDELAQSPPEDAVATDSRSSLGTFAALTHSAIVHGPHYRATIQKFCPGTVDLIPLAFPEHPASHQVAVDENRVTLFGNITPHKQPGRILRALASLSSEYPSLELNLAGDISSEFKQALLQQALALGLRRPVVHGHVSDDALVTLLQGSAVICCLRYPVTEGSSASLATALFCARPIIVSDVASFSLVPDELLCKVSYGEETFDLADALRSILSNPAEADERAVAARRWAQKRFAAEAYVDALEPLLAKAAQQEQKTVVARSLTHALLQPDGTPNMPGVHDAAEVIDWMESCQSA